MEKQLQNEGLKKSKIAKRDSIPSIWTKKSLMKRLERGPEARVKFVKSQIRNGIAFQIRSLRGRNHWSQPQLAEQIGTTQNQIYRLENPAKTKPTITSLEKIAAAFDVALMVRFVPFGQLIDWTTGTPRVDKGLSSTSLAVPSFAQEMASANSDQENVIQVPGYTENELSAQRRLPIQFLLDLQPPNVTRIDWFDKEFGKRVAPGIPQPQGEEDTLGPAAGIGVDADKQVALCGGGSDGRRRT